MSSSAMDPARSKLTPPVVSVLMPTFDRLEYLPAAVGSVFAQTFAAWELIIADDGSGPDTLAYLGTLRTLPQVKLLPLAHTGRPGAVRNAALAAARGEYVAFLDSDDLWAPDKLERQLAAFAHHPECGWCYTDFALIDARGDLVPGRSACAGSIACGAILDSLLLDATVVALPSVVMRRQLLERLGAFDPSLEMCEDDDLWLRLGACSEAIGLCAVLTHVRRHQQHGGNDLLAWLERSRVFERALERTHAPRQRALVQRARAQLAAGLARSQAQASQPRAALITCLASAHYGWPFLSWWAAGARLVARSLAPAPLRRFVRSRPGVRVAP